MLWFRCVCVFYDTDFKDVSHWLGRLCITVVSESLTWNEHTNCTLFIVFMVIKKLNAVYCLVGRSATYSSRSDKY